MAQKPLNLLSLKAKENQNVGNTSQKEVESSGQAGVANGEAQGDSISVGTESRPTQKHSESNRTGSVASDSAVATASSGGKSTASKPLLKGLNLGGTKARPTAPASPPTPKQESTKGPGDSSTRAVADAPTGLKALAQDESPGLTTVSEAIKYDDEIPAQAPERELPEELDEAMQGFVQALDSVYNPQVLHDPELCGQMIRRIMSELQEQPQYIKLIQDDDAMVMIRGMRESMGLARIRKLESKRKPSGGSRAKKATGKAAEALDDLQALAGEMGMSFE